MRRSLRPADLSHRTADHARRLFPLVHGTPVTETLVWDGPNSLEEYEKGYVTYGPPPHRNYTILDVVTGAPVGALSIRPGENPKRGDLGYWIGIPHQGRGLGTAAVARALEIAFVEMAMEKVEACAFVGNEASRRVLRRNGFRREGLVRKAILKRGRWLDEWLFGITREEWEARKAGRRRARRLAAGGAAARRSS
jgi:ribosomal-protein-alanine N-acetyltransferase